VTEVEIRTIDVLPAQRAVLEAAPDERGRLFRERVVEPLRPYWEPMAGRMPGFDPDDPRFMGIYGPADDPEAGRGGLALLERAGSYEACLAALRAAERALRPGEHGVPIERLTFSLVMTAPRPGDLAGYSGSAHPPGHAMVTVWPSEQNLPKLPAAAAHEFHHGVRFRAQPGAWPNGVSVGEYVVLEGTAEAFAAELCGQDAIGPWARALDDAQVETYRPVFRDALEVTGFDRIRGYVFGDWSAGQFGHERVGVPDFAGYTFGYRVVRRFLEETGTSAAEATYLPWREIVERSGFFG
jgi:uncharacterized protein YjaZ